MSRGSEEAIERTAQHLYMTWRAGHRTLPSFSTSDAVFRDRVVERFRELVQGHVPPRYENADD